MRLRRHYKNCKRSETEENNEYETKVNGSERETADSKAHKAQQKDEINESKVVKEAKPVKPLKRIKQLMNNPNFNMQIMVILLSLTSDSVQMDRRIDGMTSTIDKIRNITDLVNNGMQSMKAVSEVPKSIRRILE